MVGARELRRWMVELGRKMVELGRWMVELGSASSFKIHARP